MIFFLQKISFFLEFKKSPFHQFPSLGPIILKITLSFAECLQGISKESTGQDQLKSSKFFKITFATLAGEKCQELVRPQGEA